jgi:sec-independent protein translocase protein TatA
MVGISVWQLLIVLATIILLFGTKKLRGIGSDLGGLASDFKKTQAAEEEKAA